MHEYVDKVYSWWWYIELRDGFAPLMSRLCGAGHTSSIGSASSVCEVGCEEGAKVLNDPIMHDTHYPLAAGIFHHGVAAETAV